MVKQAALAKLPEMRRQMKSLQQTVDAIARGRRAETTGPHDAGRLET